jgi:hypothetical protein
VNSDSSWDTPRATNNEVASGTETLKGNDRFPVTPPTLRNRRIFSSPRTLIEGLQLCGSGLCVGRSVDRSELPGNELAFLPGRKLHRVADQMHDASLHDVIRKNRGYGFWEAFQAVDYGDEDVLGAPAADR